MQVDVKMTNHGLIAWQGVHIGFENHPIYEIKALIQDVGIIAAHSEVTVPLLITYKSEAAFRAAPPCNVYGQVSGYYPCGGRQVTGATTIQGYANCTPSPNPPSRPLSNPHQPQPPNPSQPTTAILPPTPTPVQLSIQPPCSCSVSISGASQSNAGHMVSLTASGNPPGGTYRWSVVGPGVALSQSGSTARLNATSVGTLTVHVNYRPPGVTSAGGSCTADHTVTISNIIETQTVATTPANRARLKLGIGEEVVCRIVPPTSATWSVSGGGQLSSSSGSTTTFVASKSPSTSTVNARIGSSDVTVTFTVVAPSGFNTTIQSSPGFGVLGDSQIGQRTIYNVEVVPTDVSFYNAEFQEYFQVTPPLSWTWPDRTTQTFGPSPIAWSVGYDNLTTDDIRDGPYPKTRLYSGGAFHDFSYTISWMEQYKNELAKWITFVADETTVTDFSGTSFQCKTVNRGVAGLWQGPWR
jgi:hypothetical protein